MIGLTVIIIVCLAVVQSIKVYSRIQTKSDQLTKLNIACQKVLDSYRRFATTGFSTMQWSLRNELVDDNITVQGEVGAIDNATRTRPAHIVGIMYESGVIVATKTVDAQIAQVRGAAATASVLVRAVDKLNSGAGIAYVRFTIKGQDATEVEAYTDSSGYATLKNVFLSAVSQPMVANGETASVPPGPCYFDDISPKEFVKTLSVPPVSAGMAVDLTTAPYQLVCSGVLTGTITVVGTNDPVPNYRVLAFPKPNSLVVTRSVGGKTVTTDANGVYKFVGLIPGKYAAYPQNTVPPQYPALSVPGDIYSNSGWTGFVQISSGSTTWMNFQTLPMGSISGTAYFVHGWSANKFTSTGATVDDAVIDIVPFYNSVTYTPTSTLFDMSNTTAYDQTVRNEAKINGASVTAVSGGYQFANILPRIAHKDHASYPLNQQMGKYRYRAGYYQTNGNATPIMVVNPFSANLAAVIRTDPSFASNAYIIRPLSAATTSFDATVMLNQTATNNVYILRKDMLARVVGLVNNSMNMPFGTNTGQKVSVAIGRKANVGGMLTSPAGSYIDTNFSVPATSVFDTGQVVVPNFSPDDETLVEFTYNPPAVTISKDLMAYATCYTKVLVSNTISTASVNPTDLTNVKLELYYAGTNTQSTTIPSITGMDLVNNVFSRTSVNGFETYNQFHGSTSVHLDPAQALSSVIIKSDPATLTYEQYDVRAVPPTNSRWVFTWAYKTKGPRMVVNLTAGRYEVSGPTFVFNKILRGSIRGTVTNYTNTITGVSVRVQSIGSTLTDITRTTQADACPTKAAGMQYCVQDFDFVGLPGKNIKVSWSNASYTSDNMQFEGWDGADLIYNIYLLRKATGAAVF